MKLVVEKPKKKDEEMLRTIWWSLLSLTLLGMCLFAEADLTNEKLRLPRIFGDHMVLQQGQDLPLWGKAKPGETVRVTVGDRSGETVVGADGKWMLRLKPMPVTQEAVQVKISSADEEKVFDDVLIGEVWLCSGQSNMAMGIGNMKVGEHVIAKANHPKLRMFLMPRSVSFEKAEDVEAKWVVCTPESLAPQGYGWGGFSAIGYYFGSALLNNLDRPIGLIGAWDGGTRIHCWTSLEGLQSLPGTQTDTAKRVREFLKKKASLAVDMEKHTNVLMPRYNAEFKLWKQAHDQTMAAWSEARAQAQKENNPLPPRPARAKLSRRPLAPDATFSLATVLFNAKIAPIAPYALRGVLWYQGEANAYPKQNEEYRDLLPIMIADWRKHWAQPDLPFLYVQLPNLNSHGGAEQYKEWWPILRESQRLAGSTPNTAMVVSIDVGDPNDLHPTVKKPIADRLVLAARKLAYGEDLVISGPMIDRATLQDDQVVLHFTDRGRGLMIGGVDDDLQVHESTGTPENFELAGEDGLFVPSQAKIEGDKVLVWNEVIPNPKAVRYAWDDNPEPAVNLYNKEGLPASPFKIRVGTE